jgi:hypothetical protein
VQDHLVQPAGLGVDVEARRPGDAAVCDVAHGQTIPGLGPSLP